MTNIQYPYYQLIVFDFIYDSVGSNPCPIDTFLADKLFHIRTSGRRSQVSEFLIDTAFYVTW